MPKIDMLCPTEKCKRAKEKYGYHNVVQNAGSGRIICEQCGGIYKNGNWIHTCKMCDKDVEPGELLGFFVPHRCKECDKKIVEDQKKRGKICRRCGQVYAYCCC